MKSGCLAWGLALCAVGAGARGADPDAQVLARDGRTEYRVVIAASAQPQVRAVAADFVAIFRDMTGAEIALVTDATPMSEHEIIIGPSTHLDALALYIDWDALGDEGYVIRTQPGHVALFGGPRGGTRNAVYTFLDEYLGCRFYAPQFTFVPQKPELVVGITHTVKVPAFEARNVNVAQSVDPHWAARNRVNYIYRQARHWLPKEERDKFSMADFAAHPLVAGSWFFAGCPVPKPSRRRGVDDVHGEEEIHSLHKDMLLPSALFEEHPDYFAYRAEDGNLGDGKRNPRHGSCPTSEGAYQVIVENAKQWLRNEPWARMISVSQVDRYYACGCPRCLQAYAQRGGLFTQPRRPDGTPVRPSRNRWTAGNAREAAVFLDFVNRAADEIHQEFPDVYVHTLAYYWTRYPLDNWEPADKIIIDYEFLIECRYHSIGQCPFNEDLYGLWTTLRGWTRKSSRLHVWDSCYGHSVAPYPVLKHRGLFYREMAMAGVNGIRVHMCGGPDQWLGELRAYMYAKLVWDPDYDLDAGFAEYCRHAFGGAAEPMLEYVRATQDPDSYELENWTRGAPVPGGRHIIPSDRVRTEVLQHWDQLFESALAAVADDPASLGRVRIQHKWHKVYAQQRARAEAAK